MGNERQIIYDLIEQLGGFENSAVVLQDLIKFLKTDQITEFVEYFTGNHDITIPGYETYDICLDCQETHDVNGKHTCQAKPRYVSSIVVPC